jgi:hypothetical protein
MDDIIENAKVIEHDVEEVAEKFNKINCNPIYETFKALIKLLIDLFKYCKPKIFNSKNIMYYIYILQYIMYELDYPDYVSSLDDGIENPTQTISIGDSLSYTKITNEYLKTLNKDFKIYKNIYLEKFI